MGAAAHVHAAPVPWNAQTVAYSAERRPVSQVLKDVLANQSFPVVIAADVRGDVTGQFNEPAERILAKLASAYGVVWFFDGTVLYVSSVADLRTEFIELGALSPSRVPGVLETLGLREPRFPVRVTGGGALVSGPSRYVALVAAALRAEAARHTGTGSGSGAVGSMASGPYDPAPRVRGFKLSHAQAGDITLPLEGRQNIVPGVATLLRRLGQSGGAVRLDERAAARDMIAPDPEALLPAEEGDASDTVPALSARRNAADAQPASLPVPATDAQVEADIRTNSVIVRASSELLDYYAEVIKRLDQPQQLVQIDVSILSVASSAIRDVGVALGVQHPHLVGTTDRAAGGGDGLLLRGLIGTAARHLSVQIAALERAGKVKVLSRPTVVALENRQAVLGSRSTAYVRVAGAYQTDLYPVRAGLQVKLTPRRVSTAAQPDGIHLALDIVDGQLQQAVTVDGIPVASEVGISTEAVVGNGQTLLIGGHQRENIGNERRGVPGLSRVPGLGALFRHTRRSHERTEQVFLITPRLLDAAAATPAPARPAMEG